MGSGVDDHDVASVTVIMARASTATGASAQTRWKAVGGSVRVCEGMRGVDLS